MRKKGNTKEDCLSYIKNSPLINHFKTTTAFRKSKTALPFGLKNSLRTKCDFFQQRCYLKTIFDFGTF
jgi:hypothetical protein